MSATHGNPEGQGLECKICYGDIDETNYAEYRVSASSGWYPSEFCSDCIGELLKSQFKKYVDDLAKTTCAREQRSLLERGPPINIFDKIGFPESDGAEIFDLWYTNDGQIHSAKLDGSLVGTERIVWWENQKLFVIKDEKVEEEKK